MARRREMSVFGLAFLDAMTCGLGAVVLLYMVINASVGLRAGQLTGELEAEASRLEEEVLDGHRNLVELRNTLRELEREYRIARGLSQRLIETVEDVQVELATYDDTTIARREHLNKLQADLKSLEEENKRLSALAPSEETPGDKVRTFVGDGDRQYLTGLKVGGDRVLFLVDASASMLDRTIVNVVRRRNLSDESKIRAKKWRQAAATVDWLTTQLPKRSNFQIYTFNEKAGPVLEDTAGRWLSASDRKVMDRAVAAVRQTPPEGGTSLHNAFDALRSLTPLPDNVILLTDGLPTQGATPGNRRTVTAKNRLKLYNQAIKNLPSRIPVNTILFPMEGDPKASSAYWKLAIRTGGSFLSPAEDWP